MIMLAYQTPRGMARYVGGSGLAGGTPSYRLGDATISHAAVLALCGRRRQRGRRVPTKDEGRRTNDEGRKRAST